MQDACTKEQAITPAELHAAYNDLRTEATRLAGGLTDLAQRATVYHHVYQDSGGNHLFPLPAISASVRSSRPGSSPESDSGW